MRSFTHVCCAALVALAAHSGAQAQSSTGPRRIISISPVITEILAGIGAFDRVIAVSDYCTYPAGVKNLPRVGGWQNANLERIVSLRPDLILITEPQAPFIVEKLRKLKLQYAIVPSRSLDDAFTAIAQIGRATGREAEAAALAQTTRTALETVRAKTGAVPKKSVLCVVDRAPGTLRNLTAATPGSFLAELTEIAGGRLVTAPTAGGYITINKEALVALDPEIILDVVHTPGGRLGEDERAVWAALTGLRAVRGQRVHAVRDEFILHTSQFVGRTVRLFAEAIHPELFSGQTR